MDKFFSFSTCLVLIALAVGGAYGPNIDDFFLADDYAHLIIVRDASFHEFLKVLMPQPGQNFIRPLGFIFWRVLWNLFGFNPVGHHLGSLFLHVLNCLLLIRLSFRIAGFNKETAVMTGLFAALYPAGNQAVVWASSYYDLLAVLFMLAALNFYAEFRIRHRFNLFTAVLVSWMAALASKETALIFPFLILPLEFIRFGLYDPVQSRKRRTMRITSLLLIPFFYLGFRLFFLEGMGGYPTNDIFSLHGLTELITKAVPLTFVMMLHPVNPRLPEFGSPLIVLTSVLIGVLIVFSFRRLKTGNAQALALATLWAVFGSAPLCFNLWIGLRYDLSRFAYFPAFGLALWLACGYSSVPFKRLYRRIFALIVIVLFFFALRINNRPYDIASKIPETVQRDIKEQYFPMPPSPVILLIGIPVGYYGAPVCYPHPEYNSWPFMLALSYDLESARPLDEGLSVEAGQEYIDGLPFKLFTISEKEAEIYRKQFDRERILEYRFDPEIF